MASSAVDNNFYLGQYIVSVASLMSEERTGTYLFVVTLRVHPEPRLGTPRTLQQSLQATEQNAYRHACSWARQALYDPENV